MRRNELGCSGARVLGAHCDCAEALRAQLAAVTKERDEARVDNDELNSLFELQHARVQCATKMWQEHHGKPHVLPDLGELIAWLMAEALAAAVKHDEAREQLRLANVDANEAGANYTDALSDLAQEREQAQSIARQLLVEQERRAKLEAAMETMEQSFKFATNDALRLAAGRVYCSKCYDAVIAGLGEKEGE